MKWLHRADRQQPDLSAELAAERRPTSTTSATSAAPCCAGCRPRWLYDALVLRHGVGRGAEDAARRPGQHAGHRRTRAASPTRGGGNYAVNLFGKPPRTINCDCERSNEPSLLQTVYLRNDQEVLTMLDRPDGWLKQRAGAPRRTRPSWFGRPTCASLSRLPDDREQEWRVEHLRQSGDSVRRPARSDVGACSTPRNSV